MINQESTNKFRQSQKSINNYFEGQYESEIERKKYGHGPPKNGGGRAPWKKKTKHPKSKYPRPSGGREPGTQSIDPDKVNIEGLDEFSQGLLTQGAHKSMLAIPGKIEILISNLKRYN